MLPRQQVISVCLLCTVDSALSLNFEGYTVREQEYILRCCLGNRLFHWYGAYTRDWGSMELLPENKSSELLHPGWRGLFFGKLDERMTPHLHLVSSLK